MDSLVSVAMCTYNGERFIKEQIDSILSQSYSNFELVIVDDGSKDNTVDIIKNYQLNDKRIKFLQNEKNLGFVKNFEKAISLCTGDFIALADQDDIWKKDKLAVFLEQIKDNTLIYSDAILMDKDSKETGSYLIRPNSNLVKGKCNKAFIYYNCVSGNTLMFKKELVEFILPIPEKMQYHDIWIAFVASSLGTITFTEESYTYYRRYEEQVTRKVQKNYKSLTDRLRQKENNYYLHSQNLINHCTVFYEQNFIEEDLKKILKTIIEHYSNYNKGFYDYKLSSFFDKYKNELLAIKSEDTRRRYKFRYCARNKLLKILFYSV